MARIYASAATVLACIGPSDLSSNLIYEASHPHSKLIPPYEDSDEVPMPQRREMLELLLGVKTANRVIEHWKTFSARRYFSRLWIIQELYSAHERLVLCGDSLMDWNYIIALESRFTSWGFEPDLVGEHGYDGRLVTLNDLIVSRGGGPWKLDLSDFWSIPGQFLCEDVRDRVYGVLEIFDWEGNGMQKPKPNYETSVFDLALHLMSHTRDEHPVSAAIVIDLLELGKLPTRDLVAQYQASQHLKQPVDVDWYLWPHQPRGICLLRQDCLGRLSADLELAEEEEVESATEVSRLLKSAAQMDGANATALPFSNEQKPSQIYTGDTVSAIAWPEVKPGDILIQAGHFTFVIRQVANDSYFRVVAHAIKLSQFDYRVWEYWTCGCWSQEVKESVSNQGVLLAFTSLTHPEELMMGTFSDDGYTLSSRVVRGLLNIPPIGTLVEDASTDSWKAETWARSIEQSCTEHDAEESNRWRRKPIQFAAASGCGPALETVTI